MMVLEFFLHWHWVYVPGLLCAFFLCVSSGLYLDNGGKLCLQLMDILYELNPTTAFMA